MEPNAQDAIPSQRGWYADPWNPSRWRWWDGWAWTPHLSVRPKKPALPGWLSVPVLVAACVVVPVLLVVLATMPLIVLLSLAPAVIALPVMLWLDRVEPEPPSALVHSLLWGATVAVLISSIVNATVGALAGDVIASVVSAPFIEEATKAGAILYAVKRREVDSLWGYALAVLTHALWNASAAAPGLLGNVGVGVLLLTAAAFFVAFISVAIVLYRTRRKEERRFCELVPWLAQRYGLAPHRDRVVRRLPSNASRPATRHPSATAMVRPHAHRAGPSRALTRPSAGGRPRNRAGTDGPTPSCAHELKLAWGPSGCHEAPVEEERIVAPP